MCGGLFIELSQRLFVENDPCEQQPNDLIVFIFFHFSLFLGFFDCVYAHSVSTRLTIVCCYWWHSNWLNESH